MKLKIRDMEVADVPIVTSIIGAHDKRDGQIATEYYEGYLKDQDRISSPRERNVVGVLDEQIVGVGGLTPDKYDWPSILWMNWLYVREAGYWPSALGLLYRVCDRTRGEKTLLGHQLRQILLQSNCAVQEIRFQTGGLPARLLRKR
jgi:hypothetical protein